MPPLAPPQLPRVHFTLVDPPHASPRVPLPAHLLPYGYHPEHEWPHYSHLTRSDYDAPYLRWLQPMEVDLARQVEYDMDEQDQLWLDALNQDRKRDGHPPISYEVFEIVMDKIEKEWFDLTRNIPKRTNAMPSEDSKCAICDDGECENANAIVFCDGCNLAVHQDCYGVPYIPEGQWLCRKCTVTPHKPVACVLCPRPYGAFKQTTTGQWAHLLCAIWIPDTSVSNTVYMEPIDGIEHIPKSRWKLVCYLCKKRVGACIQCANRSCYTAFHVTCAREHGLPLRMRQGAATGELRAYCDKHGEGTATPKARAATPARNRGSTNSPHPVASSSSAVAAGGSAAHPSLLKLTLKLPQESTPERTPATPAAGHTAAADPTPGSSKSARAYKTTFSRAPPVVPAKLADSIVNYVARLKLANKRDVVNLVCRYWSLKRQARRGAPLLKRIHLEPWTASATTRQQSEADKAHKLALLRLLRTDLERVRMLTDLVRKRERKKLERASLLRATVEAVVFPLEPEMRAVLDAARALDRQQFFSRPVDREEVPDYYDLIHFPMDWETMGQKLARHEYLSGSDFTGDVRLVINNARRYNTASSPVHRAAVKLLSAIEPRLVELDESAADALRGGMGGTAVVELLDEPMREALFEYGYDTRHPKGIKKRKREQRARAALEETQEQQAEVPPTRTTTGQLREKHEEDGDGMEETITGPHVSIEGHARVSGATAARKGGSAGVGTEETPRPRRRTDPIPIPNGTSRNGRKRTAALAGLDSPATPEVRAGARTSRAGAAPSSHLASRTRPTRGTSGGTAAKEDATGVDAVEDKERVGRGQGRAKGYGEPELVERAASPPLSKRDGALLLEDVDPKASFKHFETGWVLPEGSRRRSSASASASGTPRTQAVALPRTPAAAESATLAPPPPTSAAATSRKGKGRAVDPVAEEDESGDNAGPRAGSVEDEMPSWATAKRVRAGKQQDARSTATPKKAAPSTNGRVGPTPKADPKKELGDVGTPATPAPGTPAQMDAEQVRQFDRRMGELNPDIEITPKTELSEGYLVWARQPPYPFFPAEVVDPDADDTPDFIRLNRPAAANSAKSDDKVPVLFFDPKRTGGWIARSNLRELGESSEADSLLLSRAALASNRRKIQTGKLQKPYSVALKELKDAYDWAMQNAENTDDEQARLAEEKEKAPGNGGVVVGKGKKRKAKALATGAGVGPRKKR